MHEADAIDVKHLHWLHSHPEGKGGSDLGDALDPDDADAGTGPETGARVLPMLDLGPELVPLLALQGRHR